MPSPQAQPDLLERYHHILDHLPQVERRPSQQKMVQAVAQALENQRSLIVEAGPGSGKSFGYLIPLLQQSTRPIVISTATIALQEQLIHKDIPFLAAASGREDLTVKLVKGRGNYLCIQKLKEAQREFQKDKAASLHLQNLLGELQQGWDGDFAGLDWSLPRELLDEVRSTGDDCLGFRCSFYDENPYRMAREDLDKADLLIANHALYCQDIASGGALLPPHDVVVFDEAHQLKNYALNAFTQRIGKYATTKLLQKINRRLMPVPDLFVGQIQTGEAGLLSWLFQNARGRRNFRLQPDLEFLTQVENHVRVLEELNRWIAALDVKQLRVVETELDADRASVQQGKLVDQLQGLLARWQWFLEEGDTLTRLSRVNWVEIDPDHLYYELRSTPLDVAETLMEHVWQPKTAVLTSATMTVNHRLDFFQQEIGLSDAMADTLVLPSPFNFAQQCVLYLPQHPDLPDDPNHPDFVPVMAEMILDLLEHTQGRAFVLFTSVQNMRRVSELLADRLAFPWHMQGELPRNRLIDWFKTTPNSVLFATATFWEGIDVPGDALSCVIIDKIPFTSPEDPVNQATVDLMKFRGEDWFGGYALPQAILKLRQGFGRLIRTKEDRGVVAILDPRLRTKGYGQKIRYSLPKVPIVSHLVDIPSTLLESLPMAL